MRDQIVLTGIKPTGMLHLGNWVGAIRPTIELSHKPNMKTYFFIPDYHALTNFKSPDKLCEYTYGAVATCIALGLDPSQVVFYRQSDVPEVFELNWILACFSPKGLMDRAHAYKMKSNPNSDVNMGLYTYPILMAADILLMHSNWVPVGNDQQQHLEIARDLARRFNQQYRTDVFTLPEALISLAGVVIPGLDGRKMSKSYHNTIPIFAPPEHLRKLVFHIATNSSGIHDQKDIETSTIFQLYQLFSTPKQMEDLKRQYQNGIAWKDAKEALFSLLDDQLRGPRAYYETLMDNPQKLERILQEGASQAREVASETLERVRYTLGINQKRKTHGNGSSRP